MKKQTNEELGYIIPVKRRIENGKFAKAYARSLISDKYGNIRVRFDDGSFSMWSKDSTIHEPLNFNEYVSES